MKRSVEDRVAHLVGMYGAFEVDLLREGFEAIKSEVGGPETRDALEALYRGDLASAARIALAYYDRTYEHGLQKRAVDKRHPVDCAGVPLEEAARRLIADADARGF